MQGVRATRTGKARSGVVALEASFALMLICICIIGIIDLYQLSHYDAMNQHFAEAGARFGSIDAAHAVDKDGIKSAALMDAGDMAVDVAVKTSTKSGNTYVCVSTTVYPPWAGPWFINPLTATRTYVVKQ